MTSGSQGKSGNRKVFVIKELALLNFRKLRHPMKIIRKVNQIRDSLL